MRLTLTLMSIQQKRSARYPTCGRSPSRRLHPELFSISGPREGETANPFRLTAIAEKTSTAQKADPSPGSKNIYLQLTDSVTESSSTQVNVNPEPAVANATHKPASTVVLCCRGTQPVAMAVSVQKFIN